MRIDILDLTVQKFPFLNYLYSLNIDNKAHNKALKYCSDDNRKVIAKTIREIEGAGAAALEHFVEGIKSDPVKDSTLPRDGTVHQMASDALLFLEQLQNFSDVGGGMIAGQKRLVKNSRRGVLPA